MGRDAARAAASSCLEEDRLGASNRKVKSNGGPSQPRLRRMALLYRRWAIIAGFLLDFGVDFLSLLRHTLLNVVRICDALSSTVILLANEDFCCVSWRD